MKKILLVVLILSLLVFSVFAQQKVVVTFWEGMGARLGTTLTQITKLFNKEHPNIEVKLVYLGSGNQVDAKLLASLPTKSLPTMAQVKSPTAAMLETKGVVAPIYSFPGFSKTASSIYAHMLTPCSVSGKIYALPFNVDVFLLFIRPKMLEAAGITPPKTMQELAQDAKLLTIKKDGKTVRYGLGFRTTYRQFTAVAYQFGGHYLENGKITINCPQNVKALAFLVNLVKEGYAYAKFGYFDNELTSSSVAMLLGGSAELTYDLSDIAGQSDGIVMVPIPRDVDFEPMTHGQYIEIFNTASQAQQQAAWEYLKFLLSPQVQLFWAVKTGYIPVNKAVANMAQWKSFVSQNPNGVDSILVGLKNSKYFAPSVPWWTSVRDVIRTAFEDAIHFTKTPQQALNDAQKQAEEIRAKFLNK